MRLVLADIDPIHIQERITVEHSRRVSNQRNVSLSSFWRIERQADAKLTGNKKAF